MSKAKINAIAPWYGSNRMNAARVGELLEGCEWVGIGCAGGMCEVPTITARTIVVNDLHRNLINLAAVVAKLETFDELVKIICAAPFHPDTLYAAQLELLGTAPAMFFKAEASVQAAANYFIIAWMTRSGTAGTDAEATGKLALRWEAGGGDSAKRYQSAIDALPYWAEHFRRCTFSALDLFDFLDKCKDRPKHGIYVDPPFLGPGAKYKHNVGKGEAESEWHEDLAVRLGKFQQARVVVRAYDCDFVRERYGECTWNYLAFDGRKQTNAAAPEVLLTRN